MVYNFRAENNDLLAEEHICLLREEQGLTIMDLDHAPKGQMPLSKHIERSDSLADEKGFAQATELDSLPTERLEKVERRVVLKQDLTIVLLLAGCYFFAYLVRSSNDSYGDSDISTG